MSKGFRGDLTLSQMHLHYPSHEHSVLKPFSVAAVDFTGAFFVCSPVGEQKAYICLFTCANTRAVHSEVVTDLTVENFIQTFRRFVGQKSFPQLIISDNASTYQSAAKELEKLFSSTLINEHLSR